MIILGLGAVFAIGYAIHRCFQAENKPTHPQKDSSAIEKMINSQNFKFKDIHDLFEAKALTDDTLFLCIYKEKNTFNKNLDKEDFKKLLFSSNTALRQSANIAYFLLADTDAERSNRLSIVKTNIGSTKEAINQLIHQGSRIDENHSVYYKWCIKHIKKSLQTNDIKSAEETINLLQDHYCVCKCLLPGFLGAAPPKSSKLPPSISQILANLTDAERQQLPADIIN